MNHLAHRVFWNVLLLAGMGVGFAQSRALAQTFSTLYTFTGGADDGEPFGELLQDSQGNLYGTTVGQPARSFGSVFQLSPVSGGGWSLTTLYTFHGEGAQPMGALVQDGQGNLWGTTYSGGSRNCSLGCGMIYRLSKVGGVWHKETIYLFQGGRDGWAPEAGLVFDAQGNVYGTTGSGGGYCPKFSFYGCGTIFKLTPTGGGWVESLVHRFARPGDLIQPRGQLIIDHFGNLYGTATAGGPFGCGGVFEFSPSGTTWSGRPLHYFTCGNDGASPSSTLAFGQHGWLYGTTGGGGTSNQGTVFLLRPAPEGNWILETIHSFNGADGSNPAKGVTLDQDGNLYGSTNAGGENPNCPSGCGVTFKMVPQLNGLWTYSVLHSFGSTDGTYPGPVTVDSAGNVFGTTNRGGADDLGNIFEITQ